MNTKLKQIHIEEWPMAARQEAHPVEDTLERYALGALDEPELEALEEHLLLCAPCQDRLDEATEYVSLMQEATAHLAATAPVEAAWKKWFRLDWLPVPRPALAAAFVVMLAILAWQPWQKATPLEWQTVELATLRGGSAGPGALEGLALRMRLDVSGLKAEGAVAQIVSSDGKIMTEVPLLQREGGAEIEYGSSLRAGQYWVRLRQAGETLREYSLTVARR